MLEMKKNCERCFVELPENSEDAMICSFECTFCDQCAELVLQNICPNCEGLLVKRPRRHSGNIA
jgi:hypothetical protein